MKLNTKMENILKQVTIDRESIKRFKIDEDYFSINSYNGCIMITELVGPKWRKTIDSWNPEYDSEGFTEYEIDNNVVKTLDMESSYKEELKSSDGAFNLQEVVNILLYIKDRWVEILQAKFPRQVFRVVISIFDPSFDEDTERPYGSVRFFCIRGKEELESWMAIDSKYIDAAAVEYVNLPSEYKN